MQAESSSAEKKTPTIPKRPRLSMESPVEAQIEDKALSGALSPVEAQIEDKAPESDTEMVSVKQETNSERYTEEVDSAVPSEAPKEAPPPPPEDLLPSYIPPVQPKNQDGEYAY